MVKRALWMEKVKTAWSERPILWLTGVRRVGKTTLSRSMEPIAYYDCELPRVRREMEDPEFFLRNCGAKRLVFDEVHRLENPSELLKIAADHFPELQILATGSSTLGASARFRDTLAGRKRELHLLPVLFRELETFGVESLIHRLRNGGLPENLLAETFPEKDYAEWTQAFWARDIQELFRLEKRDAFLKLMELLWLQSGQLCEINSLAAPCGASRATLQNYLGVLEATGAVHVIRPFAKNKQREIVAMPKVYGFDTGFVCFAKGWRDVRPDDLGLLWEHLVLDELIAAFGRESVFYWRDKQKHEVDFILVLRGHPVIAIECKWKSRKDAGKNFRHLKTLHPEARCLVVCADAISPRRHPEGEWIETGLQEMPKAVQHLLKDKEDGSR